VVQPALGDGGRDRLESASVGISLDNRPHCAGATRSRSFAPIADDRCKVDGENGADLARSFGFGRAG